MVEPVHDLQGLVDGCDVEDEVVDLEGGAALEPLDNPCLSCAMALAVSPLGHVPETSVGERMIKIILVDHHFVGLVVSAAVAVTGR